MTLGTKICTLRTRRKMTQSDLAEACGVSFQSVQKWESDKARPTLEKLVQLSKLFAVSMDYLILDTGERASEEHKQAHVLPAYETLPSWESYPEQLKIEYTESLQEGRELAEYRELFEAVSRMPRGVCKERMADVLYNVVTAAPMQSGYGYEEPSDYEGICRSRAEQLPPKRVPKANTLRDRVAGAWYGRICGCFLGKPIEGIRTPELSRLLKETGNYPLSRYILRGELTEELLQSLHHPLGTDWYADRVTAAPADDDTNYTVLYQQVVEQYGRNFTPRDISCAWVNLQPKNAYCTAERVAYCNFIRGYLPPDSAVYKNPYREWIGAQIRADYFGYINPGDPETAAQMAWRDASISHTKNGIYGEMYMAALIALAATADDLKVAMREALLFVPQKSRFAEAIGAVLRDYENGVSEKEWFRGFYRRWDENSDHDWCHTISNAEVVAASLLYGGAEFDRSVCLAVQTGFDTDCNDATVGSILGMYHGMRGIASRWTEPLHGKLDTAIFGVGTVSIDAVIDRTLEHMAR